MSIIDDYERKQKEKDAEKAACEAKEHDEYAAREKLACEDAEVVLKQLSDLNGMDTRMGKIRVAREKSAVMIRAGETDLARVSCWYQEGTKWSIDCEYSWGDGNFTPMSGIGFCIDENRHFENRARHLGFEGGKDILAEYLLTFVKESK